MKQRVSSISRPKRKLEPADISWGRFKLALSKRTHIMGILNRTPDSFSDGGMYAREGAAVRHVMEMASAGADIIDIGGESTRPGSEGVSVDEELNRTIPIISKTASKLGIPISIDTSKSEVAEQAIAAGASIVNDVTGLRGDPKMAEVVSRTGVPVVVMHIRGTPRTMQIDPGYDSLLEEVLRDLEGSIEKARQAGVNENKIIVDPGIGFGKTAGHNLQIINNLGFFKTLKRPILIGVSRKSFIANTLKGHFIKDDDIESTGRLIGTITSCAICILKGANILRVHDVKEAVQAARIADAIVKA